MQHHNRQKSSTFPRDKEVRKIYTFTIPRESFDELNPDKQVIRQLISKHISKVDRLKKNMSYYEGKHKILDETKRENRLVCNHAKDISDTASSYFIGNPVTYKSEGDIKPLTDALELAGADETDGDNGLEASIYGLAYEYVYVKGYSAHVYVDDTEAYQALPYNRGAWHVGVNYGGRLFGTVNNRNSVGIEMCVQAGYNYEKAFQNTVQVCKQLMKQLGIPADRVVQHYDVCAKNCPSVIRAKGDWNRFKQLIGAKTATPTVDKYYRTRKSWADSKSQIGAYKSLENAKKEWKQGYTIYDWNGKAVYPVQTSKKAVVLTGKFETQLPIIRKGNSGVAVSVLQSVLGVTVDGNFGDDTETSLKVFQKNTGVKVSGTCGIDSWKKVIEHVKANTK